MRKIEERIDLRHRAVGDITVNGLLIDDIVIILQQTSSTGLRDGTGVPIAVSEVGCSPAYPCP